jgi:2-oxoglutarate ferredoxin oxidoreductase subunit beta
MSYVVMDNRIYGLTKGQASPTSREDFETSTTPDGPKQPPVRTRTVSSAYDVFCSASKFHLI